MASGLPLNHGVQLAIDVIWGSTHQRSPTGWSSQSTKGQRERTMLLGRRGGRPVERGGHEVRGIIGGGAVPRPSDACVPCLETPTCVSSQTSSSEALGHFVRVGWRERFFQRVAFKKKKNLKPSNKTRKLETHTVNRHLEGFSRRVDCPQALFLTPGKVNCHRQFRGGRGGG